MTCRGKKSGLSGVLITTTNSPITLGAMNQFSRCCKGFQLAWRRWKKLRRLKSQTSRRRRKGMKLSPSLITHGSDFTAPCNWSPQHLGMPPVDSPPFPPLCRRGNGQNTFSTYLYILHTHFSSPSRLLRHALESILLKLQDDVWQTVIFGTSVFQSGLSSGVWASFLRTPPPFPHKYPAAHAAQSELIIHSLSGSSSTSNQNRHQSTFVTMGLRPVSNLGLT